MSATAPLHEVSPQSALFESILELIRRTSTILPDDVVRAVTAARGQEVEGSNADVALNVIGCNIGLARDNSLPLCQDTGTILFYVHTPVGYDQLEFEETAIDAVRAATKKGYLRQNSVDSLTGKNSGDNTGPGSPVFHFHQWREPHVEVKLMLKGGGCENMNAQYSLPHPDLGGRDLKGVENAILDCILQAQGQGCGPGILGVCIGGDRGTGDGLANTAKEAKRSSRAFCAAFIGAARCASTAALATTIRFLSVNAHGHTGQFDRRRQSSLHLVSCRRNPKRDSIEAWLW